MPDLAQIALVAVVSYIVGSIPCGAMVARWYGVDLTKVGSQRTGATNVLRTLGKKAAAIVFAADFLKGSIAVGLAWMIYSGEPWAEVVAAISSVVGHTHSPFLGWRGGRGVMTGLGGLVAIWPQAALVAFVFGFIALVSTRYVSLASITGALTAGLIVLGLVLVAGESVAYAPYSLILTTFILFSHKDNIVRLLSGTERKIGERVAPGS